MCGPSAQEQSIANNEQSFMQTLQANYNTNDALQGAALEHINSVLEPILSAGPGQEGFTPEESSALNTQAIDTTGAAAANAERAAQTQAAGRNDSGNLPQSGVDQALESSVRSASANQLANEQLGITESDYATGRSNFDNAVSGEESLAAQYNPNATAGEANNAGTAAFGMANQINQQKNQVESDIAGGISSLAGGVVGGIGNLDQTGGSSPWEQIENFAGGF